MRRRELHSVLVSVLPVAQRVARAQDRRCLEDSRTWERCLTMRPPLFGKRQAELLREPAVNPTTASPLHTEQHPPEVGSLRVLPTMRTIAVLLLQCLSALAGDTGVRMTSAVSTNTEMGIVHIEETFTRNGQTNLIRKSSLRDGVFTGRVQRFYHEGEFVAAHVFVSSPVNMARESFTTIESSYSVGLDFSPTKQIERVIITRKKGNVLDGFTATNGVFYPVSNSELEARPVK